MREKLMAYLEQNQEALYETLSAMVRINTENFGTHGNEEPLALYLQQQLEQMGIPSDVYSPDSIAGIQNHPDYLPGRNLGNRPNITAKVPGSMGGRSLMLAAHLDTVPIGDESLWTVPPTGGLIRDGRIYGRGSGDDKSGLAVWMFLLQAFRDLGIQLKNDLYVTGYVDEEFGGGDGALACCLKYPCDFCVNLDGEEFKLSTTGAGGQRLVVTIGHPEQQDSCDLVLEGLYRCKDALEPFRKRRQAELKANPYYRDTVVPDRGLRIMAFSCGTQTSDKHQGKLDIAFYTDREQEQIQKELAELYAGISDVIRPLGLEVQKVEHRSRYFHYVSVPEENENVQLLIRSAAKASGRQLNTNGSGMSDLSIFLRCLPERAINFGADRDFGLYGGAHQPDEFIVCENLLELTKIIGQFVLDWDEKNG